MIKRLFLILVFILAANPCIAVNYCLDANAVACFLMTEGSGTTVADASGNDGALSFAGTPDWDTTDVSFAIAGSAPNSINFNGTDEWLYHADGKSTDISGADQPITVCAWVSPDRTDGNNMGIVTKYTHGNESYNMYKYSGGYAGNLTPDGSTNSEAYGTTNPAIPSWTHVCFVYNDTDIRLYLNAVLDENGADNPKTYSSGIYAGTSPFFVGKYIGPSSVDYCFDGKITEVAVFSRALALSEIKDIYNFGLTGRRVMVIP